LWAVAKLKIWLTDNKSTKYRSSSRVRIVLKRLEVRYGGSEVRNGGYQRPGFPLPRE